MKGCDVGSKESSESQAIRTQLSRSGVRLSRSKILRGFSSVSSRRPYLRILDAPQPSSLPTRSYLPLEIALPIFLRNSQWRVLHHSRYRERVPAGENVQNVQNVSSGARLRRREPRVAFARMQRFLPPCPVVIYPTMTDVRSPSSVNAPIFPFNKLMPQCHSIFRLLATTERSSVLARIAPVEDAMQYFLSSLVARRLRRRLVFSGDEMRCGKLR